MLYNSPDYAVNFRGIISAWMGSCMTREIPYQLFAVCCIEWVSPNVLGGGEGVCWFVISTTWTLLFFYLCKWDV